MISRDFLLQSLVLEAESELEDFPKHHLTVSRATTWPCNHVGTRASYRGAAAGPLGTPIFMAPLTDEFGSCIFFSRSTNKSKNPPLCWAYFLGIIQASCVFKMMFCWEVAEHSQSEVSTSMPMPYVRRPEITGVTKILTGE